MMGWEELCGLAVHQSARGRPAYKLSLGQLLATIVFHYTVRRAGTLAEHLFDLMGIKMSEGTAAAPSAPRTSDAAQDVLTRLEFDAFRPLARKRKTSQRNVFHLSCRFLGHINEILFH